MRKRFLLAFVVGLLGMAMGLFAGASPNPPGLARAIEVQEAHTDALMAITGVVGTAVGRSAGGAPVVLALTEEPGVVGIPTALDGVAVQTRVIGKIVALNRPDADGNHDHGTDDGSTGLGSVGGSSGTDRLITIGPDLFCTVGTLGARVKDNAGNVYALSNAHVYALEGSTPFGSPVAKGPTGDRILQPGRVDLSPGCGTATERDAAVIGNLADFVQLNFELGSVNTVDAAIASTTTELVGNATPSDGYGTPKSTTITAFVNQKVKKYGRTTGQTKGQVIAINATVDVGYDSGVARFVGQIIISPGAFSAGGDSGSLIVDDSKGRNKDDARKPVGLLFAGSQFTTIANPIDLVLDSFGVTVDGE